MKYMTDGTPTPAEPYIEGNYFVGSWTTGGVTGETRSVWTPGRSGCYKVILYGGGELSNGRLSPELKSFTPSSLTVTASTGDRTVSVASLQIRVSLSGITLISSQTYRVYTWTLGFVALFQ